MMRRRSQASDQEVAIELSGKGLVARIIPLAHRLEQTAAADIPAKDMAVVKRALRRMFENRARG